MPTSPPTVTLRDVHPDDFRELYLHQIDAESVRMAAFTPRDWPAFAEHWSRIIANPEGYARAAVHEGMLVGYVVAFGGEDHRELGYWIGREFWGRGLGRAAVRAALREMTIRPLYAHVAAHNIASVRVLESCGFVLLGGDPDFARDGGEAVAGLVYRLD